MLFSLYPLITKHYFILSFIICLGTLQWAAARHGKPALSLLGRWGLGWPGTLIGGGLVGGGFVWFFTTTPGLLQSGLAGGELSTLFISGGLCALAVARLAGALWGRLDSGNENKNSTPLHPSPSRERSQSFPLLRGD